MDTTTRERLTEQTHTYQLRLIERGNTITDEHKAALKRAATAITDLATGNLSGRWAIGAFPGFGKTATISAFIAAAHTLDVSKEVPLLVCQRTALALTETIQDVEWLVGNDADIDIFYSTRNPKDAEKCRKSMARIDAREVAALLATHSRILTGEDTKEFTEYNYTRRTVIYDESFIKVEAIGVHTGALKTVIAGALEHVGDRTLLAEFLRTARHKLNKTLTVLDAQQRAAEEKAAKDPACKKPQRYKAFFSVPAISHKAVTSGLDQIRKSEDVHEHSKRAKPLADNESLHDLAFTLQGKRVLLTKDRLGKTLLQWRTVIHPSIKNVLVFDASFSVRRLCDMDDTLHDLEKTWQKDAVPTNELVSYENVSIRWRPTGGGRTGITEKLFDARLWPAPSY